MNIDRFISNIKNLREAAPTNSVANGGVQNFDKFLFPRDEDLLSQDYQTPAEVGDSKDDFLGVYPVMKLQLDKSSDGPSIDSMVDASKEYFNKVTGPGSAAPLYSPIENIQNIVRGLKEDKELRKLASQERAAEKYVSRIFFQQCMALHRPACLRSHCSARSPCQRQAPTPPISSRSRQSGPK